MTDDQTRKVAELLKGERFGFLTTIRRTAGSTSRPMALQEVEFDGDLWFFAERDSQPGPAHRRLPAGQRRRGLGRHAGCRVTGDAVVVDDVAKKRELWNSAVEAWFPEGPDDDSVVLIKVRGRLGGVLGQPGRADRDGVQLRQGEGDRSSGSRAGRTRRSTSDGVSRGGSAGGDALPPLDRRRRGRDRDGHGGA